MAPLAAIGGRFLPQKPYFHVLFCYSKTFALIILSETENHKDDVCLKIYTFILEILICNLNLHN